MENTNIVTAEQQAPNTISASNAIFNVQALLAETLWLIHK